MIGLANFVIFVKRGCCNLLFLVIITEKRGSQGEIDSLTYPHMQNDKQSINFPLKHDV